MTLDIPRSLQLADFLEKKSIFLFGPRSTGKSSLIAAQLADQTVIVDLLDSKYFLPLSENPSYLREIAALHPHKILVLDEVQKLPAILDEVHWLMEQQKRIFLLTGSSARKLKRENANMQV